MATAKKDEDIPFDFPADDNETPDDEDEEDDCLDNLDDLDDEEDEDDDDDDVGNGSEDP